VKKSEIKFTITLDEQNIPDQIHWEATDNPNEGIEEAKSISIAVWDHFHKGTMKIDLWTKDMPVDEMKRFVIETIGGLGETLLSATGDRKMAGDIDTLCTELTRHVEEELRKQQQK
jgi:gliding motility-associated protein GldC